MNTIYKTVNIMVPCPFVDAPYHNSNCPVCKGLDSYDINMLLDDFKKLFVPPEKECE